MSADEIVKAVTEILKIVAWPTVVGLIFYYLRQEIKAVAARITEVTTTGFKAAPPNQNPSAPLSFEAKFIEAETSPSTDASPAGSETEAETSPSTDASPALYIAKIKAMVSEDQLAGPVKIVRDDLTKNVGPDPKNQVEALTYLSAGLNVQLAHERNYNAIFGSQLQLLEQMNPGIGVPPSVARQIYDAAKAASPEEVYRNYTFDQWIAFLQNGGLITVAEHGLGTVGNYVLTPYGRGFLKYLVDRRLSVNKPF